MQIKFHGKYDWKLFFRAVFLANQPARRQRWLLPIMLVFVLVAFYVLVLRLIETGDMLGNSSYIAVVLIAAGFVARPYLMSFLGARKLWANPAVREELSGSIHARGITYSLAIGKNEMPWSRFNRVRRARDLVTLVARDGLLVIFPRHFFRSDADWKRFNTLLDTSILAIK
jgi:hypothetical protein